MGWQMADGKTKIMNMKKEYREELKTLRRAERHISRDLNECRRECESTIALAKKTMLRAQRATAREFQRINRRRAILEGRLS
jgi:1,6-anhydro-N-acetylmuramate kinase